MHDDISIDYYRSRERRERDLALAAQDPAIAQIHGEMAEHYAQLIAAAATIRPIEVHERTSAF